MKTKLGEYIQIIGLQKALKLVSLCLETQADTTPHVREYGSEYSRRDHRTEGNGVNRAGRTGTLL
jgi:hypothetical protein